MAATIGREKEELEKRGKIPVIEKKTLHPHKNRKKKKLYYIFSFMFSNVEYYYIFFPISWELVNFLGDHTVCPRSSGPFYVVTYYIKWVTTSWTYSSFKFLIIKKFQFTYFSYGLKTMYFFSSSLICLKYTISAFSSILVEKPFSAAYFAVLSIKVDPIQRIGQAIYDKITEQQILEL